MDPEFRFGYESLNFVESYFTTVINLQSASWNEATIEYYEKKRIPQRQVLIIKRAVQEYIVRIARHGQRFFAAVLLALTVTTALFIADFLTVPDFGADFTIRVAAARFASVFAAADLAVFVDFGF